MVSNQFFILFNTHMGNFVVLFMIIIIGKMLRRIQILKIIYILSKYIYVFELVIITTTTTKFDGFRASKWMYELGDLSNWEWGVIYWKWKLRDRASWVLIILIFGVHYTFIRMQIEIALRKSILYIFFVWHMSLRQSFNLFIIFFCFI